MAEFDGALTHEEYNSPRYSYRLLFKRKLVNRPGQADRVVEFIDPASGLAKEYWVKKEVERPKFRPTDVVKAVKAAGFSKFRVTPEHSSMWKAEDAKNPSKGYGVLAYRKLVLLDSVEQLDDLRVPPGNRLEKLSGDRQDQYSFRINDQWRICFNWQAGDAYDVEITDYH